MPNVTHRIPNLLGGISQQPESIRLENQSTTSENSYPSLVEGMRKRANSEHVAKIIPALGHGIYKHHFIDRGDGERYLAVFANITVRVFDLATGNELTVELPDSTAYLTTTDYQKDLKMVTVADVTYVSNAAVTAAYGSPVSPTRDKEALVFVSNGGIQEGIFNINGDLLAKFITHDSVAAPGNFLQDQRTDEIAKQLFSNTAAGAPPFGQAGSVGLQQDAGWVAPWGGLVGGSTIWLTRTDGTDFTLEVSDSNSQDLLTYIKDIDGVSHFTKLPTIAKDGFVTKIVGVPEDDIDDYWVRFEADNGNVSSGKWIETIAPGIQTSLAPSTMPHLLIRTSATDGNGVVFSFQRANGLTPPLATLAGDDFSEFTWLDRTVGDEVTNPDPPFVGKKINNIFFAKNRLGILTGDNIVLSEAGEFFNFFRVTTSELLDSTPLFLESDGTDVVDFLSGLGFQDRVLCFSGRAQHSLFGDPILTPKTASIVKTSAYESSLYTEPEVTGEVLFFPFSRGGSLSGIREYRVLDSTVGGFTSEDITSHVAGLVDGNVINMSADSVESLLAVVTDTGKLYIYKWLDSPGQGRQLSSWVEFTFGTQCLVRSAFFGGRKLHLFIDRPVVGAGTTEMFYETMELMPTLPVDANSPAFRTLLDRRIDESGITGAFSYDIINDKTTIQMPYRKVDRDFAVFSRNDGAGVTEGVRHVITTQPASGGTNIVLDGDLTAAPLWIGEEYPWSIELSEQFARIGGNLRTDGRFQIQMLRLGLGKFVSLAATVSVVTAGTTYTYMVKDFLLAISAPPGTLSVAEGEIEIPIRAKSTDLIITLSSTDPFPASILWVDVIGDFHTHLSSV